MNRIFIKRVLLFTFCFYVCYLLLDAIIFLISHLPRATLDLDRIILGLGEVQAFLELPRILLRHLWRSESTPRLLNHLLTLLDCLTWGGLVAVIKSLWNNARE